MKTRTCPGTNANFSTFHDFRLYREQGQCHQNQIKLPLLPYTIMLPCKFSQNPPMSSEDIVHTRAYELTADRIRTKNRTPNPFISS